MDHYIVEYFLLKLAQLFLETDYWTPLFGRSSVFMVIGVDANDDILAIFLYYIADDAYRRAAEYQDIAYFNSPHVHI